MALAPFETGQIWQMGETLLKIGLVGKRLVHYKQFKSAANASPVYLSGKEDLERLLQKHQATLLPEAPAAPGRNGARRKAPSPSRAH
ncbi:MAG: hypothetical protein RJA22_2199 [Verrucomicrobiota bacterium]